MPRGIYDRSKAAQSNQQAEIAVMDQDELQAVVDKNQDKVSPFTKAELGIKAKGGEVVPGTHRVRVGNFIKPSLIGDPNTLKKFQHVSLTKEEYEEEGWIPMNWDEMYKYQEKNMLVGWDADAGYGLLKKQKPKGRKP